MHTICNSLNIAWMIGSIIAVAEVLDMNMDNDIVVIIAPSINLFAEL